MAGAVEVLTLAEKEFFYVPRGETRPTVEDSLRFAAAERSVSLSSVDLASSASFYSRGYVS